jgi:hypothetical protein
MDKEKIVFILRGIPGSGKSSIVSQPARERFGAVIWSADAFFTGKDGTYRFDPSRLPEAHGACLRGFAHDVRFNKPVVVVDNTSTSNIEAAPYEALARAFGYRVFHVVIQTDPAVGVVRNVHGVPAAAVVRMSDTLHREVEAAPPWWEVKVFSDAHEAWAFVEANLT